MKKIIDQDIHSHIELFKKLSLLNDDIEKCVKIILEGLNKGGKLILFGNGGSAADAQHIAAELVGRFNFDRPGIPAIAITTDSSILTSISNDYNFEKVFQRQLEAILNKSDIVIGISTSGNSANVVNALDYSKRVGAKTIGFTGLNSGKVGNICDVTLSVPSTETPRIQEAHIFIGHTLCNLIELKLFK